MTFSDLAMVQMQCREDGTWSYTVFSRPHAMWRSNTRLADPMECWDEIFTEMLADEDFKRDAARQMALNLVEPRRLNKKPPAGTNRRNADGKKRQRARAATAQPSGPRRQAQPPKPAISQRRASGKAR